MMAFHLITSCSSAKAGALRRAQSAGKNRGNGAFVSAPGRSRGTGGARALRTIRPLAFEGGRREGRVLAAPMAPVRIKCTGQEPQVRAEQPAFPAQWF